MRFCLLLTLCAAQPQLKVASRPFRARTNNQATITFYL